MVRATIEREDLDQRPPTTRLCSCRSTALTPPFHELLLAQRVREPEHLQHPLVRDPNEDDAMVASRLDEAAPAQTSEMVRDLRLRRPQSPRQLANGELTLVAKQLEDAQSRRLA